MADPEITGWSLDSIAERDVRMSDDILKLLQNWDNEYNNITVQQPTTSQPSLEEQSIIDRFKKNDWV